MLGKPLTLMQQRLGLKPLSLAHVFNVPVLQAQKISPGKPRASKVRKARTHALGPLVQAFDTDAHQGWGAGGRRQSARSSNRTFGLKRVMPASSPRHGTCKRSPRPAHLKNFGSRAPGQLGAGAVAYVPSAGPRASRLLSSPRSRRASSLQHLLLRKNVAHC